MSKEKTLQEKYENLLTYISKLEDRIDELENEVYKN